MKEVREIR